VSSKNRNAFCSFCKKSYHDVGPLVEGPGEVYICAECIQLCQSIIDQERRRRGTVSETSPHQETDWIDSCAKYFLEATKQKQLTPEELALLQEIAVKIGELKTLVAARADKKEPS
jgi:ATP-dependent protease Clp ATPase subunit